jgi:hypothetical protein
MRGTILRAVAVVKSILKLQHKQGWVSTKYDGNWGCQKSEQERDATSGNARAQCGHKAGIRELQPHLGLLLSPEKRKEYTPLMPCILGGDTSRPYRNGDIEAL